MKIINNIGYEFNENRKCWVVEGIEDDFSEDFIEVLSEIDGYPVKDIGSFAFSKCKTLEEIILPSSIYQICTYAFNECNNLRTITLSSIHSTLYIHANAFHGCKKLTSVHVQQGKLAVLEDAFRGCDELKFVVGEIVLLGDYAFYGCDKLNALIFANDASISANALTSTTVERLIFQGNADIKNPNNFKCYFKYNLKDTSIRCTPEFPYIDWIYDGIKIFVSK